MKKPKHFFRFELCLVILFLGFPIQMTRGDPRWEFANPLPAVDNIVALDFTDASQGWMVTEGGRLKHSIDAGRTWETVDLTDPAVGVKGLDFINSDVGWVLGGSDPETPGLERIYRTSNGGRSWNVGSAGTINQACALNSVVCIASDQGWACGSAQMGGVARPAFFRYQGNDEWTTTVLPGGAGIALNQVQSLAPGRLCAVGEQGYAAVSGDNGVNWNPVVSGTNLDLFDVSFPNPGAGFIVGGDFRRGVILRSRDGGDSWTTLANHPAQSRIVRVKADNVNSAIAISEGWADFPGMVLRMEDGQNWQSLLNCPRRLLMALTKIQDNIWVGGSNSYFIYSANGVEWTALWNNSMSEGAYSLSFIDQSLGWCAGGPGGLLRTTDGGRRWRSNVVGENMKGLAITFLDRTNGWLALEGSIEMRTQDSGRSWNQVDIAAGDVRQIIFRDSVGYALHGVSVAVTEDAGEHWNSVEVIRGMQTSASSLSVPSPEVVYAASLGDTLRRTIDGGNSWRAVPGTPFATASAVSFINDERGWVTGANAMGNFRVYGTANGGGNWSSLARLDFIPKGIRFVNSELGYLWAAPGIVWLTQDGGAHWADLNLRAAVEVRDLIVLDDGSIWICGSRGLIARYGESRLDAGNASPPLVNRYELIKVWPNPTNGGVNIQFPISFSGNQAALYDVLGRRIGNFPFPALGRSGQFCSLSLSGYPAGQYWLTFNQDSETQAVRIHLVK